MSGLIVRPGDTLVVPVAPPSALNSGERERMKRLIEADMPGVRVIIAEGIAPVPFVYRPDPPEVERARHPMMYAEPEFMPVLVDEDALPDEAPNLVKAAEKRIAEQLDRVRQAQAQVEREVPEGMSTVDDPVTGRPLGYIRVDDGDDSP